MQSFVGSLDAIRVRAAAQSQSGTEYDSEAVSISQENVQCQPKTDRHAGIPNSTLSVTPLATTLARVKVTQVLPRRTTGWSPNLSLVPSFGPKGKVKTQGITSSSGLKRGDLELVGYLSDAAGSRNLVLDLSIIHDRIGSSTANPHLNGTLSHRDTPDSPLNEAANRKLNKYCNHYANNHSASLSCLLSLAPLHACTNSFVFSFYRLIGRPRLTSPSWVRQRNLTRTSSASAARHSTLI